MNYLAHIFLSGNDRRLQVGNFIGDFVKGQKYLEFPEQISRGIIMHRKIDRYTDSHPVYRDMIAVLRPEFGRYSGIMADMYADYFLASGFEEFSKEKSLRLFAYNFYFSTLIYYRHLPKRVKNFIFHFISTNRLMQYRTHSGLYDSLGIMSEYKSSAIQPEKGIRFLENNEEGLKVYFYSFMSDLMEYSSSEIQI